MADATQFTRDIGIMGIAFSAGESSNNGGIGSITYPSVLETMKSQGRIQSLSYSLWLDDLAANTGTILFGGVDTSKYVGSLISLPIQTDGNSGLKTSFTVAWTGLSLSGEGQNVDLAPSSAQPAIFDSGTTLTYLPDDIANQIFNALGVTTDPSIGQVVPCRLQANNLTFTYTFGGPGGPGGPAIAVPLSELLIPLTTASGAPYTGKGQNPLCSFGIDAAGSNPILFGDTFLRSAYVVYDLENLQIGLAQTNFNAQPIPGSNVEPIVHSANIPDVASTASAISVQQTFSRKPLNTAAGASASGSQAAEQTVSRSATLRLQASGTTAASVTGATSSMVSSTRAPSATASSRSSASSAAATTSANSGMTTSGIDSLGYLLTSVLGLFLA
ncbi:hypothetical protein LTR66_015095 [Elasticomyces elasticus]|nr:hypothetical protein LTR66_015095 [Elasticomyces elasticus]